MGRKSRTRAQAVKDMRDLAIYINEDCRKALSHSMSKTAEYVTSAERGSAVLAKTTHSLFQAIFNAPEEVKTWFGEELKIVEDLRAERLIKPGDQT